MYHVKIGCRISSRAEHEYSCVSVTYVLLVFGDKTAGAYGLVSTFTVQSLADAKRNLTAVQTLLRNILALAPSEQNDVTVVDQLLARGIIIQLLNIGELA